MTLIERIASREAVIGIVGVGYVGLPLALRFGEVGFRVIGFDVDAARVDLLNSGRSGIRQFPDSTVVAARKSGFEATGDYARLSECDAVAICVPTPLDEHREPDLGFVERTMAAAQPHLRAGQILSLESTTWPGTTEEILRPVIEKAGLSIGKDFFLVYSPEREDPGNADYSTVTIPKVVGGTTPACLAAGEALYGAIIERVVPVSSTRTAEMVKLLENIHRAVNIGLVNEMKVTAERMGLDIFEVIDAAATKPFGFTPYYPGPGIGGHCIPIDPFYLTWKAREYGVDTRFIELAGEVNAAMPEYVVEKLVRALNDRGKALKGAKVLALGIAYKRDIDDVRESPAVVVMEHLRSWGADVAYSDPCVPKFPRMRQHRFDLESVDLGPEMLAGYDAAILLTDHSAFDYGMIREHAPLLVDTRGKYREEFANVVRA